MKNLLLFVSIAVSSSLGPYYFKEILSLWAVPPLSSFLIRATLVFLLIVLEVGFWFCHPYLLKQVKCRLSALGFKVLCNVTPKPLPPSSLTPPGCMSRLHMCFCLLRCFHALSFLVFRCRPLQVC